MNEAETPTLSSSSLESLFFVLRTDINSNKLQEYDSDDSELSDDSIVQHVQFQSGISFTSLVDYNTNTMKTKKSTDKKDDNTFFDFLSYVTYDHPQGKYDDDDIGTGDHTEDDDDDVKMTDDNDGKDNDMDNDNDLEDDNNCQRGIHKYVWTSNNCCCYDETFLRQPPVQSHIYKLDVIVQYNTNTNDTNVTNDTTKQQQQQQQQQRKIQVSGTDHIAVASTISGILQLFIQSQSQQQQSLSSSSLVSSITFQAFATTPRLVFPLITINDDIVPLPFPILSSLHLSFVGLNDTNTIQLFSKYFQQIELKQCTTSDDNDNSTCVSYQNLFLNASTYNGTPTPTTISSNNGIEELTISCTQPEFTKLANQLLVASTSVDGEETENNNNNKICTIKKLHFKLHFYLQGDMFSNFCKALSILCNKNLLILIIEYLDIVDSAWDTLFTNTIPNLLQLQQLHLKFTDNFVDTYRRLTTERRTNRTQIVLSSLVQRQQNIMEAAENETNPIPYKFQQLVWPSFQQDEVIFTQIKEQFVL